MPLGRFAFSGVEAADSSNARKCKPLLDSGNSIGTYSKWRVYQLGSLGPVHLRLCEKLRCATRLFIFMLKANLVAPR